MSNLREAAQLAIDAYSVDIGFRASRITREALEQLRAALSQPDNKAQPVADPVAVYRLMKKTDGIWVPASEFFSGHPDASWEELSSKSPEDWCIQRRVTGKQIAEGFVKALSVTPQPPAEQVKAQPCGWSDDQMERFAWSCINPPLGADSIRERLAKFRACEAERGIAAPQPPAEQTNPTDDHLWGKTISDRDIYHEWADRLAEAIAEHLGVDIGEHSNLNNPWQQAIAAIEEAQPPAEQEPKRPENCSTGHCSCVECHFKQDAELSDYPPLPRRHCYADDGEECYTADQMRAYADADRAARRGAK